MRFPGRAPPYPPPAVLGAPLPTMLIVRRRRRGPVIGRELRRVRAVIVLGRNRVSIETRELRLSSRELTCLFLRRHSCEIKDL